MHWCRLAKNIGGNQNIGVKDWGKRVLITDESIGISQLLGDMCPAAHHSLCL